MQFKFDFYIIFLKAGVFIAILLLRRDTTTKAVYTRRHWIGVFLTVLESPWPSWWGRWWHQAGRHGCCSVAKSWCLVHKPKSEIEMGPGGGFGNHNATPLPNHTPLPSWMFFLTILKRPTSWEPNLQICEPLGGHSHSNHHSQFNRLTT